MKPNTIALCPHPHRNQVDAYTACRLPCISRAQPPPRSFTYMLSFEALKELREAENPCELFFSALHFTQSSFSYPISVLLTRKIATMPRTTIPDASPSMPDYTYLNFPPQMPEPVLTFDHDEEDGPPVNADGEGEEAEPKPREKLIKLDKMYVSYYNVLLLNQCVHY